jgi:RNA polymerase sigma-70 factor (ECF subfamily)
VAAGFLDAGEEDSGMISEVDSWVLVRAVQQGDIAQFGVLYERYAPGLRGYFVTRGFDFATAEDLTSETYVRALRSIGSVSYQGKDVVAWLLAIARNLAVDHVKAARSRHEICVADLPDAGLVDDPERKIMARAELVDVGAWLRSLSSEQRQCLVLRRILGRSVDETAVSMGRSRGAVRALLYRAVHRLNESFAT